MLIVQVRRSINEQQKRDLNSILKRTGLDEFIQFYFTTNVRVSHILSVPRDRVRCKDDCATCLIAEKRDRCFIKKCYQ